MFAPFPIVGKVLRPYGEVRPPFNAKITLPFLAYLMVITPTAAISDQIRILALGDSLTAGYGLRQPDSFPSQLTRQLQNADIKSEIINAGVSGDTTSGALQRIDWLMDRRFDLAIVELGANDALRGIDPALTRQNLEKIVQKCQSS